MSDWKTEVGDPASGVFGEPARDIDRPDLSQAEIDAIYLGIERARCCEQFVDLAAGCAAGEADCLCFAIGARIVEALRRQAPKAADSERLSNIHDD